MKEQIEEMFNIIVDGIIDGEDNNGVPTGNTCADIAETLYNAGYRKQEWISVEDKFPAVDKILGWDGTAMWFVDAKGICESLQNVITQNGITHWLPIPEPPRMKGENNEKI